LLMGQSSTWPLSSAAFDDRQRAFHGERPTVSSTCRSDSDQNYYPPSTCPSTAVAQRQVKKKMIKTSDKRCFFVADNFTRNTLALLVIQPVSVAANQGISHACVNRKREQGLNLLPVRLPLLPHQSKNCILLVLLQVLNMPRLTAD